MQCNNQVCTPSEHHATTVTEQGNISCRILYIGDPMCSWCWGIAPALQWLNEVARVRHIPFEITVGGLRADSGDTWTPKFRAFLRHHWQEISAVSGQDFSFNLLDLPHFDYNTEPACRAVVVARQMLSENGRNHHLYAFFHALQHKFYVANQDTKVLDYYRDICIGQGLDFAEFSHRFLSQAARDAAQADFVRCRSLGIRAFPTVLFQDHEGMHLLATGFVDQEKLATTFMQWIEP